MRPIKRGDHVVVKKEVQEGPRPASYQIDEAGIVHVIEARTNQALVNFRFTGRLWVPLEALDHFDKHYTLEIGDRVRMVQDPRNEIPDGIIGMEGIIASVDQTDTRLPYFIAFGGPGDPEQLRFHRWCSAASVQPVESLAEAVAKAIKSITDAARKQS